MHEIFAFSYQEYFTELSLLITILLALIYAMLIHNLIKHMREMVRLKYHIDKRAEFDENRVKIVLSIVFIMWLAYIIGVLYLLFGLDSTSADDFEIQKRIASMMIVVMTIGAYALFFINNRVKSDIEHIKTITSESNDESEPI